MEQKLCSQHAGHGETFGVQGRGHFYEEVGAIRDVVQNHMLEIIALLTMERKLPAVWMRFGMRSSESSGHTASRSSDIVRSSF
jgi:hypothetical protein